MAKKDYEVAKAVKLGGIEYVTGDTVELDESKGKRLQAQGFLLEEPAPGEAPEPKKSSKDAPKGGKKSSGDGL